MSANTLPLDNEEYYRAKRTHTGHNRQVHKSITASLGVIHAMVNRSASGTSAFLIVVAECHTISKGIFADLATVFAAVVIHSGRFTGGFLGKGSFILRLGSEVMVTNLAGVSDRIQVGNYTELIHVHFCLSKSCNIAYIVTYGQIQHHRLLLTTVGRQCCLAQCGDSSLNVYAP